MLLLLFQMLLLCTTPQLWQLPKLPLHFLFFFFILVIVIAKFVGRILNVEHGLLVTVKGHAKRNAVNDILISLYYYSDV